MTNLPADNSVPKKESVRVEKLLMVLLFIITITQFSGWGYQSVRFVLASIFDVEVTSTFFDTIIGLMAMFASTLIFLGCVLWWKKKLAAKSYLYFGPIIFIVKNVFDMVNEVVLLKMRVVAVEMVHIEQLASKIGNELFQLAFWVFVLFYFKSKIMDSQTASEEVLVEGDQNVEMQ